jgi:hypothetical protein
MMMELTESDRDEFSVTVFYGDHVHSYITRWVSPPKAVVTAEFLAKTNGNTFDRIIITDGGDDTVFYWERGKGITWLTPEERTK